MCNLTQDIVTTGESLVKAPVIMYIHTLKHTLKISRYNYLCLELNKMDGRAMVPKVGIPLEPTTTYCN